jgi:hypothetical protein
MKPNLVLVLFGLSTFCLATPMLTGYSGAPGSQGLCAGSCHGTTGGGIIVSGFPTTYTAGYSYTVTVTRDGGEVVNNFNASVRIGSGPEIAGTLGAGQFTELYSVGGEAQGVHMASPDHDNATFTWTAPNPQVGTVKLYLSGHQGTMEGPNTAVVLTAQSGGIEEQRHGAAGQSFRLEQTVVTTHLVVRAENQWSPVRVRILDSDGRVKARLAIAAGSNQAVVWPLLDVRGQRLPAGTYYAAFHAAGTHGVSKFAVVAR